MIVTEVKKEDIYDQNELKQPEIPEPASKKPVIKKEKASKEKKGKKIPSFKKVINLNQTKKDKEIQEEIPEPVIAPVQKYKKSIRDDENSHPNVSLEQDEQELLEKQAVEEEEKPKGFLKRLFESRSTLKELSKVTSVIPLLDITEEGYVRLEDGQFLGILLLHSGEQRSKNAEDIARVSANLQKHLRTMSGDQKWVSLKFPSNVTAQKKYWEQKYNNASSTAIQEAIQTKYKELELIEKTRNNIEYYFFIYGEEIETLNQRMGEAQTSLRSSFYMERLKKEKVIQVLGKMNNQNSKIMN